MKKTNFFSAKTLAIVACASLMFTNCDEENFSVTPVDPTDPTELPDASVIVSATTVDVKNSKELDATYSLKFPYTVMAGEDGSVAATTLKDVTSSVEGYYTVTKDIAIPAVAKGHMVYIPTVFYTSATDADAIVSEPEVSDDAPEAGETSQPVELEVKAGETSVVSIPVDAGYKLANYEAVENDIKGLSYADGRAVSETEVMARVKEALTNLAQSLKDFKKETVAVELNVPENTETVTYTLTPHTKKGTIELSTTQEGKTWAITAEVEIVEYCVYKIIYTDNEGNSHAGHAGHGNSNNAGGGSAGK